MSRASSWEPSWRRLGHVLGANIVPSWRPTSKENRNQINAKINQKRMPSKFHFWCDVGGFSEGKLRAPTSDQKSMPTSKGSANLILVGRGDMAFHNNTTIDVQLIFNFLGSKLAPKIDLKSTEN